VSRIAEARDDAMVEPLDESFAYQYESTIIMPQPPLPVVDTVVVVHIRSAVGSVSTPLLTLGRWSTESIAILSRLRSSLEYLEDWTLVELLLIIVMS
jgi:hypothetical protein